MKNWSLRQKIWTIVGGLALAFVISTAFSLNSLIKIREIAIEMTSTTQPRNDISSEIKDNQRRLSILSLESIAFSKDDDLAKNAQDLQTVIAKQEKDLKNYEAVQIESDKNILKDYVELYTKEFLPGIKATQLLGMQNKNDEAFATYTQAVLSVRPKLTKMVDALNDISAADLAEQAKETNASINNGIQVSLAVSTVSIFLSLLISFFVLRSLTETIARIVKGLAESSEQVTSAATQIASASEELSQATTEQAASLEETAASVEEMNSMVSKSSENASSAATSSSSSQKKALEGKAIAEKMTQSMDEINESNNAIMTQVNQSNESMAGIVKVIEQIDKKTKVINEIVNKTELLSFNASVEAARAGDHGKGFAVVAEEVGNLARMSGAAAEEIATLLEESISKVNEIVRTTKTSVEKLIGEGKQTVERGAQVARKCAEAFEEVVGNVTSVSGMANEISSASQEQSRGISEITKAMSQLDQMTQQNAATSEECASAAEELSAQAESLKEAVGQLVMTVNGNDGSHPNISAKSASTATHTVRRPAKINTKSNNVVHLKSKKAKSFSHQEPVLKKASGHAPDYDSDGFKDI